MTREIVQALHRVDERFLLGVIEIAQHLDAESRRLGVRPPPLAPLAGHPAFV